jgi:hypothetical protein
MTKPAMKSSNLYTLVVAFASLASVASAQSQGGEARYPRNDAESREISGSRPAAIKITGRSAPGDVLSRGTMRSRVVGSRVEQECEFNYSFDVPLLFGSREVTIQHQKDCTAVLESVTDIDVVEAPDAVAVAAVAPSGMRSIAQLASKLWETIFPTVSAQSYTLRTLYHHIYTCGIACAGGADGLTALQGWIDYRYNGFDARMDGALSWFCTSGTNGAGQSNCQPPLHQIGVPMFPVNVGWLGYAIIVGRAWGPANLVMSDEYGRFFLAPAGNPIAFDHTMRQQRIAFSNGSVNCSSTITGSYVQGPVRSACVVTAR